MLRGGDGVRNPPTPILFEVICFGQEGLLFVNMPNVAQLLCVVDHIVH